MVIFQQIKHTTHIFTAPMYYYFFYIK